MKLHLPVIRVERDSILRGASRLAAVGDPKEGR